MTPPGASSRLAGLLAIAVLAVGCGSSGDSTTATTTPAATVASTAAPAATATAAVAGKVSANDATEEELTAAFEAAGIPNAERWAKEVAEYRPYDLSDTTWAHLREELAKYDPDPQVVEQIIATLQ